MKTTRRQSAIIAKILENKDEDSLRRIRDRMVIACKIADALGERNISQKAFAAMMGKSESEISDWLSGTRNFTLDTLSDIEHCLGIGLIDRAGVENHVIIPQIV